MRTREAILRDIEARGAQMERAIKVQMALQGIEERAANRPTLRKDTKVFVDFAEGFDLNDETRELKTILKKITISYPKQGLFIERGDAPKTRKGKPIKHSPRRKRPIFSAVLPIHVERLKVEIAELYGVDISKNIRINIPGIYSSMKQTTSYV